MGYMNFFKSLEREDNVSAPIIVVWLCTYLALQEKDSIVKEKALGKVRLKQSTPDMNISR